MRFCEDVGDVVSGPDIGYKEGAILHVFSNEMIVYINMLDSLMETWVFGECYRAVVVAEGWCQICVMESDFIE